MGDDISDIAALETCIGKTPGPMHLKVIDHLDAGAVRWLAATPLIFIGFGTPGNIGVTLGGGPPGFAEAAGPARLRIPKRYIDSPEAIARGDGFGALCLIPTVGESLRLNGRVAAITDDAITIDIAECYIHCAKALIRSDFWKADPSAEIASDPAEFLAASRFIALASMDAGGHADMSPKGDPAGATIRLENGVAHFAERPGNRRADSFRNILTQPQIAVAALIPGCTRIALLHGAARLTQDPKLRGIFAVRDKSPQLVTCLDPRHIDIIDSPALQRAGVWPARAPESAIDPAAVLVGHVKLSKERGLQASLVRAATSLPGLMQKGLDRDYKTNLY